MSKPKRIIIHWTAGGLKANSTDLSHYHYIFEGDGTIRNGRHSVLSNCPIVKDREYAMHCGGGNSWSAGYALCGGPRGYRLGEITRLSYERMCLRIAQDIHKWGITLGKDTVMTHYEFGLANPRTSSAGKPDISSLPWAPEIHAKDVGDHIRSSINWYLKNQVLKKVVKEKSPIPDNGSED
jgi:hypothetical protein